jgi:hypothetical protein
MAASDREASGPKGGAAAGVTSNMLHPGAVRTDIMREMPWLVRSVINLFFIDVVKGAKTSIMLASDPTLSSASGKYYDQCELDSYADVVTDQALREQLWQESEAFTAG